MKTLQNNFTTPEQSKPLLELGVPRWTADEYRDGKGYRHSLEGILDVELFFQNFPDYLPCWSVGRLMEIIKICSNVPIDWTGGLNEEREILEVVDSTLYALYLGKHMDFSKLEG